MFIKSYPQLVLRHFSTTSKYQLFITSQYFKSYKKLIDFSKVPKVNEDDLVVQFVRGWGPGGQKVNKTSNAVVMKHTPTGIVIKCHETRSQLKNKEIALELLTNKLDLHFNGEDAVENQKKRILQKESEQKEAKQKKIAQLKASFKEREGLE